MDIEFCDLTYELNKNNICIRKSRKTLLNNISGKFFVGKINAILGPSGSGKTTLLNILSGYVGKGFKGKIFMNGVEREKIKYRKAFCYIMQEEQLPCHTTVLKLMMLLANLKLSQSVKTEVKQEKINEILTQLGLESVLNTLVKDLSGGQRKRLSLALELLGNPKVLCLDEPTTGLDNVSTSQIIQILSRLAREGRTIIMTIHQPAASLFKYFNHVYFVASGKCIFQGSPDEIVPFLQTTGYSCPISYNPMDYIIELLDDSKNIDLFSNKMKNCKSDSQDENINRENIDTFTQIISNESSSKWFEFWILFQRYIYQTINNKIAITIQLIHYINSSILLGIFYYDFANNGEKVHETYIFILTYVLFFTYTRMIISVLYIPTEIKIMKKEYFNHWYDLNSYFCAFSCSLLPFQILYNFIYISIVYYLVGFPNKIWIYLVFIIIGNLIASISDNLGFIIGSICNPVNGSIVSSALIILFINCGYYGIDYAKEISWGMHLLKSSTMMDNALTTLTVATYGFDRETLNCDTEIFCNFAKPKAFLNFLNLTDYDFYKNFTILIFMLIFSKILSYLILRKQLK